MGDNQSFLALDWVKGEIEETLKQSRQALEAYVENPEDNTQMRFCLAYLHQVLGTLQMVEFYGAALLAEEMEKLCLALINDKVSRVADGQEVLMRAILQLPPYLDRVKASRRDLPLILLPLLNDLRAVRGEPLMSETALFTPDLSAGERAPIQVAPATIDSALVKKIRQAYQVSLLGLIRNDAMPENLARLAQVFSRLEKTAGASPIRELWLVGAALIEGVSERTIEVGTSVKMLLGQIDRQLRTVGDVQGQRAPVDLLKNLLYYIAKSTGTSSRIRAVKDLYRLDEALPGESLVNEERARMSGPDRDAMKSVVDALCEELARVKDALDIFVRKPETERNISDLSGMIPILKQVADTVAVLGLGQPRRILQEQIDIIDGFIASGEMPKDAALLDIAGALLYVEATLMGMVAEKPMGQPAFNPASEFSAQDQLSEAQAAVLRESRSALEKAKDAVIEYIASQWNPEHLKVIPEQIDTVRGSLSILSLRRPADILVSASRYVTERLLGGEHRPDWQEMDTLADVITSVEYYLERVANDAQGGDSILDIAERGLEKLGYGVNAEEVAESVQEEIAEQPDAGQWSENAEAVFEAELESSQAEPEVDLPLETREEEVIKSADDAQDHSSPGTPEATTSDALSLGGETLVLENDGAHDALAFSEQLSSEEQLSSQQPSTESLDDMSFEALEAELGLEPMAELDSLSDEFAVADLEASFDAPADSTDFDSVSLAGDALASEGAGEEEALPELADSFADSAIVTSETSEDLLFATDELSAPEAIDIPAMTEQTAVAVVAESVAPKKPVLPVLTAMPQDDFDFDEEIREIFVEEAEEVMQAIGEYFPKWAANFDDTESLLEFRRGFHTLKGSGRMVGAKVVGELAWAIENMLNKVRDKILGPDQVMVNLVSEALAVIPDLVEDFSQKVPPRYNTSPLMAVAEAISRGEILTTMDVAHAAEQVQGLIEPESDNSADFDALAASLSLDAEPAISSLDDAVVVAPVDAVENALMAEDGLGSVEQGTLVEEGVIDISSTELSIEDMMDEISALEEIKLEGVESIELLDSVEDFPESVEEEPLEESAIAVIDIAPTEIEEADVEEVKAEPEIDPALLEIFTSEAESHLEVIQNYLSGIDPERHTATISDEVLRSLHTLKGSAGMADIMPVAELAAPLEHLFKDLRNQFGHVKRDHIKALQDGHALINASIADLQYGGNGRVDGLLEMIGRIRQLDHDRLALLEKQQVEKLDLSVVQEVTAATKGLVACFMELGIDHVLDAPWELDGWLQGTEFTEKVGVLQQELSRLQAVAAERDVQPLAQLCENMIAVYARVESLEIAVDGDLLNDLASAHDEIVNVFDTLAASQTVYANETVLARLLDLVEMPQAVPAPDINDEPAQATFVQDVSQQSLADQMTESSESEAAWREAEVERPADLVDPELLEIFLEEADEVLEAAQGELDHWLGNADNTPALASLQRHLHTLKGGARLAEIRALGDLAHELEFLYEGLVDGRYGATTELKKLLQRCHDKLADMVSELRDQGSCGSGAELVAAISAYRRNPAGSVDMAPAEAVVAAEEVLSGEMDASVLDSVEAPDAGQSSALEDFAEALLAESVVEPDTAVMNELVEPVDSSVTDIVESHDDVFAEFFPEQAAEEEVIAAVPVPEIPQDIKSSLFTSVSLANAEEQMFDPELLEIFMEEAGEIIDETSEQLAIWKGNPDNTLPVQQLQRGLHTLKGGARMAEITPLGDLSHHLENLYEGVCDGLMKPTTVLFNLLYRCHDRLAEAVESLNQNGVCPPTEDLIEQIKRYIVDPDNFQETPSVVTLTPVEPAEEIVDAVSTPLPMAPLQPITIDAAPVPENVDSDILDIFLEESEELAEGIESSLADWLEHRDASEPLEALLRHLHTLKGGARLAGLKGLGDLAHDWETDLVAIQSGAKQANDEFFYGLIDRQDAILNTIRRVREGAHGGAVSSESTPVAAAPAPVKVETAFVQESQSAATAVVQRTRGTAPSMQGGFKKDTAARGPQEMIRVPSDLLEKLVNLAGETSITRSRVEMGVHGFAQTVEEMGSTIQRLADQLRRMDSEMETQIISRHNEEAADKYEDFDPLEMDQYSSLNQLSKALAESASDLLDLKSTLLDKARDTETLLLQQSRINTELQEGLMHSRMVPFSRLVPRLKRIVRQIGQEINKPADLDVINPEGEMDRTLLERIVAPLEHMLRNAVDHGLETPEGRAAAGKPAQGRVTLTLSREGGEVVLVLQDDGRGINTEAVRKKALERGLIKEGQDIPDQEVIQFIFHAGFSTAAAVTQISGRGVGMDVVQSEIKQMGGVISIHSVQGQGTTFTIRLPFTVAVNRALMVRVGEDSYAISLSQIEGIVRASPYELETYYGPDAPLFEYAGIAYRLSYLGEFVHNTKSPNLVGNMLPLPVLLIRGGDNHIAIQVDQLIGSREIVVKAVGAQLATVAGISGATILGDGSVVIILDIAAMLRAAAMTRPQAMLPESASAAPAITTETDTRRVRQVMVVDDSVTVRKVTSRLLERHGYDVLLAKDGMDAIAKLEDARPDIMLLDIEMPRMDGFEVASLVRHNPNLEELPIIMITSRTGEKHRERAFQIGVNAYMGKPFQEEQLLETIRELLAAHAVK